MQPLKEALDKKDEPEWLHYSPAQAFAQEVERKQRPVANGRTRLEGRTWYQFEMHPQEYWTLWSNTIIHRIHQGVLEHVKQLAENESSDEATLP